MSAKVRHLPGRHPVRGTPHTLVSWARRALVPTSVERIELRRLERAIGPGAVEPVVAEFPRAEVLEGLEAMADEALDIVQAAADMEEAPVSFALVSVGADGEDKVRQRLRRSPTPPSGDATSLVVQELRQLVQQQGQLTVSMVRQVQAGQAQMAKAMAAQHELTAALFNERREAVGMQQEALALFANTAAETAGATRTLEEREAAREGRSQARLMQAAALVAVGVAKDPDIKQLGMSFLGMAQKAEADAERELAADLDEEE